MQKFAVVVALWTLSASGHVSYGQHSESGAARTGGFCNGRLWNVLDEQTKLAWLEAYSNGVTYALLTTAITTRVNDAPSQVYASVSAKIESIFPSLTWVEVRKALDRFYDSPENGPISMPEAVRVLSMKVAGVPQAEIDKRVAYMRQVAIRTLQEESNKH
jgi:hypothetical protein